MRGFFNSLTVFEKTVYVTGILLLCLIAYVDFRWMSIGDKAWLLFSTEEWLAGKKLYVDIFEVNPPLIYWIYFLPCYLSAHLGVLTDYNFLALLAFATLLLVLYVSHRLIQYNPQFSHAKMQAEFCLLLASVFMSFTNPMYFFDRDHIFLLLTFPYALRWMPSLSEAGISRSLRIAVGVMAGIGFCLKPHSMVVFAVVQAMYFLRRCSPAILFSVENMLMYCMVFAYTAAMWVFAPDYLHTIAPMALATYGAINRKSSQAVFFFVAVIRLGVTLADFRPRYSSPYRQDIYYLLALCAAFLLYALVNNGWGYTWNPLLSLVMIVTGFVLWEFLYLTKEHSEQGLPTRQFQFGARACLLNLFASVAVVLLIVYTGLVMSCGNYMDCPGGRRFMDNITRSNGGKPLQSFGTISINADLWVYLSEKTGAPWVTRFNQVWMLPRFFIASPEFIDRNHWILDYVGRAYGEDLQRNKPELVFVDDDEDFYSVRGHVDLEKFMLDIPEFRNEWRYYRLVGRIDGVGGPSPKEHSGYFVYKRME